VALAGIAFNGRAYCCCGILKNSARNRCPIKLPKLKLTIKCTIMNVKPEQKHNSDKMPIDTTSSHNSSKPIVGSSGIRIRQQIIFYCQSILGMLISHFIPTYLFWFWIAVSLYIGHLINIKNYKDEN